MNHNMKLNARSFEQISKGLKIYEIRLNDEKRSNIKVGDLITFSKLPELKKNIVVNVLDIVRSNNFEELFTKFSPVLAGWPKNSKPKQCSKDMLKYYSLEEQNKYGVLAIKLKIIEPN